MLVLTRKPGESVRIGDNIYVTVTELKTGRVALAFDAPRSVSIVRAEIEQKRRRRKARRKSSLSHSTPNDTPPKG